MTGISTTGLGLPTAQSLFATGSGTTAIGIAPDPNSTTPVTGPTVSGPGGTTALPSASPSDFQGVNPTPLDQPHPQYPQLIQSHVAVLQAIGTPEGVIAQIAQSAPAADYMDRYIQGEIMQNPEGWDAFVGNPTGTARAGLQQLVPGVELPAPGQGTPGVVPGQGRVDGVNVPGITQPIVGPEQGSGEGLIKGLVFAAAAVGVGLLGWKFLKNRNAAKDAAQLLGSSDQAKGLLVGAAAGEGTGGAVRGLIDTMHGGAGGWFGKADDAGAGARKLLEMQATVGGGVSTQGANTAATLNLITSGLGPGNGWTHGIGITSMAHNQPFMDVAKVAFQGELLALGEKALERNQLGEFTAALGLLAHLGQQTPATTGAAVKQQGMQQFFAGVSNMLA